ncbi:MAG: NAD(P)/FAD-dependent oxidoreductase [Candidatus Moranbacteria bacterium]|nr:NAD(P)/FAD-dependent oxidoreductase [Candidatus Moranbacteria bacterium]
MSKNPEQHFFDIAVIGGGATGMMAAFWASQKGARVVLIEKNERLGRKVSMTGKGRCNITQENFTKETLVNALGRKGRFLFSALHKFDVKKTKDFFEKSGIKLKTERGGRVFPQSDSAEEIIDTFRKMLTKNGVVLMRKSKIKSFEIKDSKIEKIITRKTEVIARQYIICTGGKSYPITGSTGDGYQWAKKFGHRIITPTPALTPIKTINDWATELQGVSLRNVRLSVFQNNKKQTDRFGEMLFTHFGISGPIVLDVSYEIGKLLKKDRVKISIDLKPALEFKELDQRIQKDFEKYHNRKFINALDDLLPQKMIPTIVKISKIDPDKKTNEISKEDRKKLTALLKDLVLNVDELVGFKNAIVTKGGINLREINPNTMQSRKIDNLYFAGEILDLNGPTGGYNLQICWTTGYVAGISASQNSL